MSSPSAAKIHFPLRKHTTANTAASTCQAMMIQLPAALASAQMSLQNGTPRAAIVSTVASTMTASTDRRPSFDQ